MNNSIAHSESIYWVRIETRNLLQSLFLHSQTRFESNSFSRKYQHVLFVRPGFFTIDFLTCCFASIIFRWERSIGPNDLAKHFVWPFVNSKLVEIGKQAWARAELMESKAKISKLKEGHPFSSERIEKKNELKKKENKVINRKGLQPRSWNMRKSLETFPTELIHAYLKFHSISLNRIYYLCLHIYAFSKLSIDYQYMHHMRVTS